MAPEQEGPVHSKSRTPPPEKVHVFPTILMGTGSGCWFLDTDIAVNTTCFSYYLKRQERDESQTSIEKSMP